MPNLTLPANVSLITQWFYFDQPTLATNPSIHSFRGRIFSLGSISAGSSMGRRVRSG
ncbi:hypothetical protein BCAR13_730044 [Paraburkholderia caribensis]|nr:hypothetical protein BCAR13_730044 [Paraburkholderia caribensis]